MNSSFLYHAWGLYSLECTREEYKGNTIILHVQSKKPQKTCPKCGKCNLVKNGYRTRDSLGLPIGGKKIIIRMKVNATSANTMAAITINRRTSHLRQAVVPTPIVLQNMWWTYCDP